MKRHSYSLLRRLYRIFLFVVILSVLSVVLFFVVLFILQNFITIAQEIDYYFYTSSNASYLLLSDLEKQSNLQASKNSSKYLTMVLGPKVDFTKIKNKDVKNSKNTKITNRSIKKLDTNLYKIVIPKIGVNTNILRTGSLKKRMFRGVAIVNAFGRPNKKGKPTILVSHRFGYVWWTPKYRRLNSFYNIDKLRVGNKIFIYWQGKLYKYKIVKREISSVINDYKHDLIIYSCVSYFNPKRYIVYADKY